MITRLMKSVRQYKSRAILTPVVMVVEAAMEILIPFVMTLLVGVIEGAQEDVRVGARVACKRRSGRQACF